MMPVTNLMQDIVINTLDEVLKKEENKKITDNARADIIAYVLNRVPPKYVTSERGLLYGTLDSHYQVQQRVDILLLIYEAIEIILNRREPPDSVKEIVIPEKATYLPHIVGQVLEESTLSVIADVEVTLLYDGKQAAMEDPSWKNPYTTNLTSKGHFHFWPKYDEKKIGKGPQVNFTIRFRHPDCPEQSIIIAVDIIKSADFGKTHFIPTVLLKAQASFAADPPSQQ
ncbi:MAG: late competence development ComFB family protein [Spirochaetes bacterium]|nr:late competence development ComFB family protein [Spirochaetota bacterium]